MSEEVILPGILDYLKYAKSIKLRIGLASSSGSDWINFFLDKFNPHHFFKYILTKDHVKNVKPSPEVYKLAIMKMGLKNDEIIVFEDSQNGVSAAKAAQLFTIAIPNKITGKSMIFKADLYLDSLADISLKELIKSIKKRSNGYH